MNYWFDSLGETIVERPALPFGVALDVDIAIVGGGLTGLWTAYYLAKADPGLRIVVLEKRFAGFGASGRNGGWCSALFPASTAKLVRQHGLTAAIAQRRAMIDTVAEVERVTLAEGIGCDFVRGGTVSLARSAVQWDSARAEVAESERWGVDDIRLTDRGTFDPACARLHPAKLVRGLARVVETLGVTIYEGTEVLDWTSGRVTTARGVVTAKTVVSALEGYGATLSKTHRAVLPLYSLMIATEPLADAVWDEIGIEHGQTFTDFRHLLVYGQRTADNRFAFGGRGARYHYGSAIRESYDRVPAVFAHLKRSLDDIFPAAAGAAVTHRWGGPLGVPRDWHATASFDPASGIAHAGGYVGDGLSTTNLAGRTLTDLILGRSTSLTALPWANHHSPRWEPEPLRFIGSNLGTSAMSFADAEEKATRRPSVIARLMAPLTGH
jgi:glycine/D-amino acid oxidase-like deaminating enzyme